jgi:SpoIID/LytB domain protein
MMRPMRRAAALLAAGVSLAALLVGGSVSPAAAAVPPSFHFTGGGWGHGVGMSQYGALGMARGGATATQILTHYYTGTSVTPVRDDAELRVNLVHAATSAVLRSQAAATGGGAVEVTLAGATPLLGSAADTWSLSVSGTSVAVQRGQTVVGTAATVTFRWGGTRSPGTAGTAPTLLLVGSQAYRYGTIDARVVSGRLEVVNTVRLHDEYLRGIGEMPSSWPAAALQAQVAASRSYALSRYAGGVRSACSCHVYDDTYDQVFVGWSKESGSYGAQWVAAVSATAPTSATGLTVTYGGSPVTAYFFSSSGGRTENSEDVWVATLPWARSVDDHWSSDPSVNPTYAEWSRDKTQAEVAAAFGLTDVVRLDLSARTRGGAVDLAVATSSTGAQAVLPGVTLRSRLALPSAWVRRAAVRLAGVDRWSTAVAVGAQAASSGAGVVLVSGESAHLVDGMVAAPLARRKGAPVLLATAAGLPAETAREVTRRRATTAWLVGGSAALGSGVEAGLRSLGVTTIRRVAGPDRYATAAAVAAEMALTPGGGAVVVNGADLPGALAAAGPAAGAGRPLLLVTSVAVPPATRDALVALAPRGVTVVGSPTQVSPAVVGTLPSPWRAFGADRYATAAIVARAFAPLVGTSTVVVASGADASLVDALAAGALGRPVLLTTPGALSPAAAGWLREQPAVVRLIAVGGPAALPEAVLTQARNA